MILPGRLSDTTLGDVLGMLFREQATGFLELIDPHGRVHRVTLRDGLIASVESAEGPRLGEILGIEEDAPRAEGRLGDWLLRRGLVEERQLSGALRAQNLARLESLFALPNAAIRFRAPRPREEDPTAPPPLSKEEFLKGRPRHRNRGEQSSGGSTRHRALRVLGLSDGASPLAVKTAFRQLAQQYHPDRHPRVGARERAELFRRFAEISRAYHSLSA